MKSGAPFVLRSSTGTFRGCLPQTGLIDGEKNRELVLHFHGALERKGWYQTAKEDCKRRRDPASMGYHKKYFKARKPENKAIIKERNLTQGER